MNKEEKRKSKGGKRYPANQILACLTRTDAVFSPLGRGRRMPEGNKGKLAATKHAVVLMTVARGRPCVAGERGKATVLSHTEWRGETHDICTKYHVAAEFLHRSEMKSSDG